ncbi:hypothetical protein [Bradyrhizobium sp. SZCCHNRI1073]|uniref:hypothetical protein n=1 Tax=Bradyrhizobium sp. SZCCHNRI1073 TaxID=3057280 RepID=UPI002915F152|nr:hypothetical protein [Bradyrhizobium sp. SZCCHNRI1073]
MAEVIAFPVPERPSGNGAREALIDIGKGCPFHVEADVAAHWADDVLIHLAFHGFKVVPLEPADG